MKNTIPFGPLGYVTFKRTYARRLKENNINSPTEEFHQTIERVLNGCEKQLKINFTTEEKEEAKRIFLELKGSVAGRFLWQLGTKTVDRLGLMSLQNCAGVVVNEPIRPFTWTMDALMLGCVPPTTPILTENGVKNFKDVEIGDLVYSFNSETKELELKEVIKKHKVLVPKHDNIKINGLYGSFITSKKHPVLVFRKGYWEYVNAGDIVVGDFLQKAAFSNDIKFNDKAWLAGSYLGDGCSNYTDQNKLRIRILKPNESFILKFSEILSLYSKESVSFKKIEKGSGRYNVDIFYIEKIFKNTDFINFFKDTVELCGVKKTYIIGIPEWIKKSYDKNIMLSFLAGLIDSDGSISKDRKITIATVSKKLKDELVTYLPIFGIYPWVKKCKGRGYKGVGGAEDYYKISISVFDMLPYVDFLNHSDKKQRLLSCLTSTWQGKKQVVIPPTMVDDECKKLNLGCYKEWHFRERLKNYNTVGTSYYNKLGASYDTLLKYDIVTEIQDNLNIDDNFLDITVKDNHSYLVGDGSFYVLHNCGVGYNIQREHIYKLPKVKKVKIIRQDTKDADFIVPDSREGWVKLLEKVLEAHFITGKGFTYSTICVRSKGAIISGFGGVSSGPEELCWGMTEISKVLNSRAGKQIRPIDALDIMNIIGYVVVSGNVRRSAQIAIGDMDDLQFLNAKRWDLGNIPNWRAMSNNSVVCNDISLLPEQYWQGAEGNGEFYGLVNINLARSVGRVGDTRYPDPEVEVSNPCSEQFLANFETCCLAEIFLPRIESKEELLKIAKLLYRINKHSLALDCHSSETEDIVHKNMRMGIGVTGYLQASEEQRKWLPNVYEELRKFDVEYSKENNFSTSIKLCTVKPSGTLSLLPGVTPGVHPAYSQYYIRTIRMSANSDLVETCRANGYPTEYQLNFDGTEDRSTVVVSFPCKVPDGTILAKDMTAIDQLNYVKRLQTEWSDNAVSCTVYYKKEELSEIKQWLKENYNTSIKSVSFLLHSDHGFKQAPYQEITKEQYEELMSKITPIENINVNETDLLDSQECASGVCPIK